MALLDAYGREIDTSKLEQEEAGPSVAGVRQILSDHPSYGLTPYKLGSILRQAEAGDVKAYFELAEDMEEKDLHYRAVLQTRKLQVAGLNITVEAASDKKEDVADADFIREWIDREELQGELVDILDAIGKGYSITEIMWKQESHQWTPRCLEWRDPRWFELDKTDGKTPLLQNERGEWEPLTPGKYIVHHSAGKSGLPIRGGLARAVSWIWLFANYDLKSWVSFLEGFGKPWRIGKYGTGASANDKATLMRAVRSLAGDAAAIIPQGMEIAIIEARISGNVDAYEKMARYLNSLISKAVLGQTGTTDVGQHVGTANAHEKVQDNIERFDAGQLSVTCNRDIVRPMIVLNRGERKKYPRIKIFRPDLEDTNSLVKNVVSLVPLGLRVEKSWMNDKLGIPDPDKGAPLLAVPGVPQEEELKKQENLAAASQEIPAPEGNTQKDAIDNAVEEALSEWEPLIKPVVDPIEELLRECSALPDDAARYEALLRRLPDLVKNQDVAILTEKLAQALYGRPRCVKKEDLMF